MNFIDLHNSKTRYATSATFVNSVVLVVAEILRNDIPVRKKVHDKCLYDIAF